MRGKSLRLTNDQVNRIRSVAARILGVDARVRVFGSRARDDARGGDIDLLFETDAVLQNRAETLCRLHGALTLALGERKIDILLRYARTPQSPILERAQRTGVPLL